MSSIRWSVVIKTAPRKRSYLEAALDSLDRAGWPPDEVFLSVEPGVNVGTLPAVKKVVRNQRNPGCWQNHLSALQFLFDRSAHASHPEGYLLVLEDDVQFAPGLRAHLDANPPPRDGVVSLYTAAPNYRSPEGWHQVQLHRPIRTYGALALAFLPEIAGRLLADPPKPYNVEGTDHWVGRFCQLQGIPYYCHSPGFVRHLGYVSTMPGMENHPQKNRQAGPLWSATEKS